MTERGRQAIINVLLENQRQMNEQSRNPCGEVPLGDFQMCFLPPLPPPEPPTLIQRIWDWTIARIPVRVKKSRLVAKAIDNDRFYKVVKWWYYRILKRVPPHRGFKRISIPLIRRIYPQLIANQILSVQPLLGPTGLQYYLRHRYSVTNAERRINTELGLPQGVRDGGRLQRRANDDRPDIFRHGL